MRRRGAIDQAFAWRPTAAIIDIGLPGVTGYAVAQYMEMARYAGFDWHFAKPADATFLIGVLENPQQRPPAGRRAAIPLNP